MGLGFWVLDPQAPKLKALSPLNPKDQEFGAKKRLMSRWSGMALRCDESLGSSLVLYVRVPFRALLVSGCCNNSLEKRKGYPKVENYIYIYI